MDSSNNALSGQDVELATNIGRLRDIHPDWLPYYDTIYIGDPFCSLFPKNLSFNAKDLRSAIEQLKAAGKRVFYTTPVEPWTDEAERTVPLVAGALEAGVDGIEVLNEGILYMVATEFPQAKIHANGFMRVFNSRAAAVLKDYNLRRLSPYYELSLPEIAELQNSGLELEIVIHGQIPLGYAELCMIHPDRIKKQTPCAGDCYKSNRLRHADKNLILNSAGRVTTSGKDLCMLPHLQALMHKGYRIFRIESRLRDNQYRAEVGRAYRDAIALLFSSGHPSYLDCDILAGTSPDGFCNGYFFELPGTAFVAREEGARFFK